MLIQKIYKSRASLASLSSALLFAAAPHAVAKQGERVDPVITLSQVQSFGNAFVPTVPTSALKRKVAVTNGRKVSAKRKAPVDHFRTGLALKSKGDTNKALIEFLKASQKNPRQINAFYEQALIFRQQGYLKLADSALEQALRIAKSATKPSKTKNKTQIAANDLNRIRLLLATVRLEQGNVGSAAEELSRSLGIPLSVKANDAVDSASSSEKDSPTTVLQSLHPKLEEEESHAKVVEEKFAAKSEQQVEGKNLEGSKEKEQEPAEKTEQAKANASKESANDATVSELIKDGLASLKDHVLSSFSFFSMPRINMEAEKVATSQKDESAKKKSRRDNRKKEKKPAIDTQLAREFANDADENINSTAKVDGMIEDSKEPSKPKTASARKRRSWFEKRLSLSPEIEAKSESNKDKQVVDEGTIEDLTAKNEPVKNQAIENSEDNKANGDKAEIDQRHDVVLTSKTAALTFTPEESTSDEISKNESESAQINESDSFSLTMPESLTKRISLVASLLSAFNNSDKREAAKEKPAEKALDPIDERLKYLAEHGTSSLKEGEAFMFSEESGEATLFMSNGEVIRRTIAIARAHEEVAKLRRPDILIPEELLYNLALMAKILPKQDEPKEIVGEQAESAPKLKAPTLIATPRSFSDWLKGVLNL